jgi:GntR family transcriptional regulator, rspAB operon transcriptional repressor
MRDKESVLFSEKAYGLLKKGILEMKVSLKEPLSESKLALMIGMSRTPVREALKRLTNEGTLISSDKRGYFLNIPTMRDIKDLYEMRTILETAAVGLAIKRLDLEKLEEFEKHFLLYQERTRDEVSSEFEFVKLGWEFHFFIIESAGNEKLGQVIRTIYDQLEMSRIYSYDKRRTAAVDEHLKIVAALKEGDGKKAQAVMEEHLRNAYHVLTNIL